MKQRRDATRVRRDAKRDEPALVRSASSRGTLVRDLLSSAPPVDASRVYRSSRKSARNGEDAGGLCAPAASAFVVPMSCATKDRSGNFAG